MGSVKNKRSGDPAPEKTDDEGSEPSKRAARARVVEERWAEKAGQCTADAKATGKRCSRSAREGFMVCIMHGAGNSKRELAGKRRPAGTPITHGLYSNRARQSAAVMLAAGEYETAGEQLYKLDTVAARTWVALEHADRAVALAMKWLRTAEENATRTDQDGSGAKALRTFAHALEIAQNVLARLESIAATRHRMQSSAEGAISKMEMIAMLRLVAAWVREIAADESVPREHIADELMQRVHAYFAGQQSATARPQ